MTARHTPAPWVIYRGAECDCPGDTYHETDCEPWHVMNVGTPIPRPDLQPAHVARVYRHSVPDDEAEANARLIAAAPEMLAALRDIAFQLERMRESDLWRAPWDGIDGGTSWAASFTLPAEDVAWAAIARAEGR